MLIRLGPAHQPLNDAEMVAQDMRNVGVGLAEPDDDLEQLPDRTAGAAGFFRQPERAQPGLADEIDLRERKGTLAFAVAGSFGNTVEKRVQIRRAEIEGMRAVQRVRGYRLVHLFDPDRVGGIAFFKVPRGAR